MSTSTSSRAKTWSYIRAGIGLTFLAWAVSPWGLASQYRNITYAARHAPRLQRALARDPAFANVRAGITTSSGGAVAISGTIPSVELAPRLQAIVEATKPPVKVRYFLRTSAPPGEIGRLIPASAFKPTE